MSLLLPQPKSFAVVDALAIVADGAVGAAAGFEVFDSGVLHTSFEPHASALPHPAPAVAAVVVVVVAGLEGA
jgi:hypothetical protein